MNADDLERELAMVSRELERCLVHFTAVVGVALRLQKEGVDESILRLAELTACRDEVRRLRTSIEADADQAILYGLKKGTRWTK